MDSITHIALGACMGEIFAGRTLGRKAMVWGGLAQTIPDFDVISGFWMDLPSELLAHRAITHSFFFILLLTPLLARLARRIHGSRGPGFSTWCFFLGSELLVHIILDAFNGYGTGWFEPFSHYRVSFNAIYVVDPFFSLLPIISMVLLIVLPAIHKRRPFIAAIAILLPVIYLSYAVFNKTRVERVISQQLAADYPAATRYFTSPTPLNSWLWFVVAGNDSGYQIGYRSVFDKDPITPFHYFPSNRQWLEPLKDNRGLQKLKTFSEGYFTVERYGDSLVFNDLRFGQVKGWYDPEAPFVFHYYLEHEGSNDLVVQRGRFSGWDKTVFRSLVARIRGEKIKPHKRL